MEPDDYKETIRSMAEMLKEWKIDTSPNWGVYGPNDPDPEIGNLNGGRRWVGDYDLPNGYYPREEEDDYDEESFSNYIKRMRLKRDEEEEEQEEQEEFTDVGGDIIRLVEILVKNIANVTMKTSDLHVWTVEYRGIVLITIGEDVIVAKPVGFEELTDDEEDYIRSYVVDALKNKQLENLENNTNTSTESGARKLDL